jgi:polysaccharide export outer membrane protein
MGVVMALRPVFAMTALALSLGGCALGPDGAEDRMSLTAPVEVVVDTPGADAIIATARANAARYAAAPAVVRQDYSSSRPYLLDTGDRIRIFVYGQPSLSRLYTVDQEGRISVPLLGTVKVRGITTYALEDVLRARLGRDLVRDPQVSVDVQQNRPFFIHGEVRNAGQFPYVSGMTVEMAVAIAGGYSERANERRQRISRRIDGITETTEVPPDFEIEPGDTIYVEERFF